MSTAASRAFCYTRNHLLNRSSWSIRVSALPLSISQTQIRCKSTGQKKKIKLPRTIAAESRTQLWDNSREIHELGRELIRIHSRMRDTAWATKGPYSVRTEPTIALLPKEITVRNNTVYVGDKRIPNIWLRDNCQCSSCVHEATKQRLLDTFSIPQDIAIARSKPLKNVLIIDWSDGHKSEYRYRLLKQLAIHSNSKSSNRRAQTAISLWDSSISTSPPKVSNNPDEPILPILQNLRKFGFCYVDNTPFDTPDATEALLRRISFIRETHYGGFYDFTADLASKDTAYTNIALEAHTDTTYFSDPAGLQAFHLLSHTDGSGGASLLVDGFKVARELNEQDPHAYRILATVNVHAHASGNEGISIQPYRGFPVFEHDTETGDLLRVRWNSADRASIELDIERVGAWYDAARKFDALLKKKENEYWEQLKPGRVLIFDNWRVLHGRSAFTGKRRICGGYVNRDDWISKFKMEEYGREKVLESLVQ
ncbi:hypothetical protein NX059_006424 [Plenodomus lindquistii]|nr:hypothetical protein NX059_006424 [Plenodomus lindquistii]